ncbi:MAG: transglutaminase-like domain-containing protein [Candidatus Aenigmatarchaeota archaeon]
MRRSFGFSGRECRILSRLDTPVKIQDFIDKLEYNLEENGDTYYSPATVLKYKKADCIEGAIFAAAVLRFHGYPPLLLDITSSNDDSDHVLAVFKHKGRWGAIGKSEYAFFAYREPVYKTIRELAMSYFELYFNYWGKKTMRSFSKKPLNLAMFDKKGWMTSKKFVPYIATQLDRIPHEKVLKKGMDISLRKVTHVDKESGELWVDKKGLLKTMKKNGY